MIAAASFVSIFFLAAPFPLIVFAAAVLGYLRADGEAQIQPITVGPLKTLKTVATWLVVWFAPLLAIVALFGRDHVLSQLSVFFSKLAIVTFGGAYAVLAYMAQDVVARYGWLDAGAMITASASRRPHPVP
jgi:chromate transporter